MSRIITLLSVTIFFLSASFITTANANNRFDIKKMVRQEAAKSNVPISLALAVAKVESDFNARALSSAGARGVMQIMPATSQQEFGISPNRLWDPRLNIRLGVQFLEQLHRQYDGRWDLALSHYNGGTVKGSTPHKRTRNYIKNVRKWQHVYQEQANLWDAKTGQTNIPEDYEHTVLQDWEPRSPPHDAEQDDEWFEEDGQHYDNTRIIIVDRREDRRWRRPPPPRRGHFRRNGPPRHHFN